MPHIKLDAHQLVAAIEERLCEANASVVLANVAAAFQRYTDAHEGQADFYPDLTGVVAGHLREMSDTARDVESGQKSMKPARAVRVGKHGSREPR